MDRLLKSVPGRVVAKFLKDQAPNWAILIAWNGLFAMFPIVVFASSLLGIALHVFGVSSDKIYTTVFQVIPDPGIRDQVIAALGGVKSQTGVLFIVGLLGLLLGGSALFGAMEQAFAYIYHARPRDFLLQKLVAFGMVLLFTALVGVAVGTAAILPALKDIPNIPSFLTSGEATFMLQVIVGITAGFILFQSIYFVIPNRRQNWLKVVPGSLVAGVLFELVTLLFPLYLSVNKGVNQYGKTFGLFFILMTFFFLLGLITMVGVEVNSVLYPEEVEHPRRQRATPPVPAATARPDQRGAAQPRPSPNGAGGPVRSGMKARTAVLIAVGASIAGLLLGRRSTGSG
jgi:membrane protein